MKGALKFAVLVGVALYLVACLALYLRQRALLFPTDSRDVALDVGEVPGAMLVELRTGDGEVLKAWWVPPRTEAQSVYLYFHGNAETLESRAGRFTLLTQEGAGLLGVSWRGYGGSTGKPSEQGLRRDAQTAYDWLRGQEIAPQRMILFGESIGSGIAVWLAAHENAGALVLDSPYTSIVDVGRELYPWLPVGLLARDPFDSMQWVSAITLPVLVYHCTGDSVVPFQMGEELFAALASADKRFERIERECHVPSVQPLLPQFRELETRTGRSAQ